MWRSLESGEDAIAGLARVRFFVLGISSIKQALTGIAVVSSLAGCSFFGYDDGISSGPNCLYDDPCASFQEPCVIPDCIPDTGHLLGTQELVDIALNNHPVTKESWHKAKAAVYTAKASQFAYAPDATASGTYWWTDHKSQLRLIQGGNPVYTPRETSEDFTLSYLLLDFGGRAASVRLAQEALQVLNWQHNRRVQDVVIGVVRAYHNYVGQQALFVAKELDYNDAQTNLDAAETLYKAGLKTHVDVLQAKANWVSSRLALETVRGQLNADLGILKTAMGIPVNSCLELEPLPEKIPMNEIGCDVDAFIEAAQCQRPELAELNAALRQGRAELVLTASSAMPTLSANIALNRTTYAKRRVGETHSTAGNLSINIPLTDLFIVAAKKKALKEQIAADQAAYDAQALEIAVEVLNSYYALKTNEQTVLFSEEQLTYAQAAHEAMKEQYKHGVATILDLLTAQSVLSNARAQKATSRTTWLTSLSELAYATGSLARCDPPMACRPCPIPQLCD